MCDKDGALALSFDREMTSLEEIPLCMNTCT